MTIILQKAEQTKGYVNNKYPVEKQVEMASSIKSNFLEVIDDCISYTENAMKITFTDPLYGLKSLKSAAETLDTAIDLYSFVENVGFTYNFYNEAIPFSCIQNFDDVASPQHLLNGILQDSEL